MVDGMEDIMAGEEDLVDIMGGVDEGIVMDMVVAIMASLGIVVIIMVIQIVNKITNNNQILGK
jgi:hypothetical protein